METKQVLKTVNRSSDKVIWTEAILIQEILGKESFVQFSAGRDSSFLVNKTFKTLVLSLPNKIRISKAAIS